MSTSDDDDDDDDDDDNDEDEDENDDDDDDDDDADDDDDDDDGDSHHHFTPLIESVIHHLSLIADAFHTSAAAEALAEGRLKHASVVFCTLASAGTTPPPT